MNQNLSSLFVVFFRFHTLEIRNLAVDKSLDAWPASRKPLHAVGIGDDEVKTRLISSHIDAAGCGLVIVACQYGSPIGFVEGQIVVTIIDIQVSIGELECHF